MPAQRIDRQAFPQEKAPELLHVVGLDALARRCLNRRGERKVPVAQPGVAWGSKGPLATAHGSRWTSAPTRHRQAAGSSRGQRVQTWIVVATPSVGWLGRALGWAGQGRAGLGWEGKSYYKSCDARQLTATKTTTCSLMSSRTSYSSMPRTLARTWCRLASRPIRSATSAAVPAHPPVHGSVCWPNTAAMQSEGKACGQVRQQRKVRQGLRQEGRALRGTEHHKALARALHPWPVGGAVCCTVCGAVCCTCVVRCVSWRTWRVCACVRAFV